METQRVENEAYGEFCGRVMRNLGKRVGAGDCEDLRLIRNLQDTAKLAEGVAITGLLGQGYSYAEIGQALGISRQAVHKAHVTYRHRA